MNDTLPTWFETADAAIAQLKSEGFVFDQYDPLYPWRSQSGIVTARVKYNERREAYQIEAMA